MLCPYNPPGYEEPKDDWRGMQIVKVLAIQFFPTIYWFLLSTSFSNTRSRCSYLIMRDQVLHPYKTSGKIIRLYVVIFVFWDSEWEEWYSARNACRHSPNLIFSSCLRARNFDLIVSFPNIRKFSYVFVVFINYLRVVIFDLHYIDDIFADFEITQYILCTFYPLNFA